MVYIVVISCSVKINGSFFPTNSSCGHREKFNGSVIRFVSQEINQRQIGGPLGVRQSVSFGSTSTR